MGPSDTLTYQVLDTLTGIEAIAAAWDALLDQSPCNRAFSCSSWFLASCRLNHSLSPRVIVARRGEKIVGIFPLVLNNASTITAFASELSDYNDIVAQEDDYSVVAAILEYAISFAGDGKRVVLARIRSDSNCWRAARELNVASDFEQVSDGSTRHVRLSSNYDDFLSTRSRNFRKSINRAQRTAANNNLAIRELRPETFAPSRLPEAFLALNRERWGARGYYELPFPQSFVLELLPTVFAQGRMRAFALMKDERLLGLDLCVVGRKSLGTWNGGFLSEVEKCSPGNLLLAAGIKEAFAMNMEEYDLLRGNEPYKERWANGIRTIGRLEFEHGRLTLCESKRAEAAMS